MIAAGWVHRHQLIVTEFLHAENRLLKDRQRGRRIRFTDAERALLARKAKAVGRRHHAIYAMAVLRKYSISGRLTRKCASCAELCHGRRVIFLVRTTLRLLSGRGRSIRAIERTRAWSADNWAQQRKPVSAIERSRMRDSPFLRLRRL